MSTQTYDLIILLGVVMLIAVIIYWSAQYGAGMVSDLMDEAPAVLQASFASYPASLCGVDGDVFLNHRLIQRSPMYVAMNSTHVQIKSAGTIYGNTERSGYVRYGDRPALPFVNCLFDVVKKNVRFNENLHHSITLNKTGSTLVIGVR